MIAHPFTAKVPQTSPSDYAFLREGIKAKGQINPIVTKDGVIWDGRNRETICQELGIEAHYEEYTGPLTAAEYILQVNLRRNLTPQQRDAMIVDFAMEVVPRLREEAREAKKNGQSRGGSAPKKASVAFATELSSKPMGHTHKQFRKLISESRKADQAIAVIEHDDLAAKVRNGELSLNVAGKEAVRRNKAKRQQNQSKQAPKQYERPAPMKFPTFEETGFPVNGTMAEKDAHHRKYGRTPLFPKVVKDMLNNQAVVEMCVAAILTVSNDLQPSSEAFFEALDQLLAWVPKPEKGEDYAIKFAAKAKKSLALLEVRLPLAVERLTKLHQTLRQRSI